MAATTTATAAAASTTAAAAAAAATVGHSLFSYHPQHGASKQWLALVSFVGVPLPGTGAWTGAMIASILEMDFWPAMSALFTGVVSAGLIMSAITLAGTAGLAFVTVILLSFLAASLRS